MESESPRCPYTVTVRRNPPRRVKKTPATNPLPPPPSHSNAAVTSSAAVKAKAKNIIIPFSLEEILLQEGEGEGEGEVSHNPNPPVLFKPSTEEISENIRVFLRIRPLDTKRASSKKIISDGRSRSKLISPKMEKKKKINKICLAVNNDSRSVTLSAPQSLQDARRLKTEVYDGFTHVFQSDSLQAEVYERVMDPLVSDFISGKSGMLAAMGPTGSGKTHTVFGCPREPGMVPLALRKIFNYKGENCPSQRPRSYYISMFEISSERGKGEKILDLSPDGADLCMQQSIIKGLQEVLVSDVSEAEALIARGMLKRATATTNSNSQSSRSQCIINIRVAPETFDGNVEVQSNYAILTIVDLAGAEKEKKTGNQGTRLLESNFINNTSMVFGLCLRSLLEHQKNPKKTFQKHFQNSLLTKYLRDYLEGKKRMTLILTVKPGEDDYPDTSFLLRQASPFMKIKFSNVEEQSNLPYQKRQISAVPRVEHAKRRKFSEVETSEIDGKSARDEPSVLEKEVILEHCQKCEPFLRSANSSCTKKCCNELAEMKRKEEIMKNFSKALWNVLKQYKKKLEESETGVQTLQKNIKEENVRYLKLEKELKDLKSCHSYCSRHSLDASSSIQVGTDADFGTNGSPQLTVAESNNLYKVGVDYSPPNSKPEECNRERCNPTEKKSGEIFLQMEGSDMLTYDSYLTIKDLKQQNYQGDTPLTHCVNENSKSFSEEVNDAQDLKALKDSETMDNFSAGDAKCPPMKKKVVSIIEEGDAEDIKDLKNLETVDNFSSLHIPATGLGYSESMSSTSQSNMLLEDDKCPQMDQKKESFKEENDCEYLKDLKFLETMDNFSSVNVAATCSSSSQSQILAGDEKCPPMEQKAFPGSSGSPNEEVNFDACNAKKCEPERSSPCKPSSVEKKPRRRLLPASSILLKEISGLDLEVENVEPKMQGEYVPVTPQLMSSPVAVASSYYSRPFLVSMTSAPSASNDLKSQRPILDLNSGMAVAEGENRESDGLRQLLFSRQGVSLLVRGADEIHEFGAGVKAEGTEYWVGQAHPMNFKQQSPWR